VALATGFGMWALPAATLIQFTASCQWYTLLEPLNCRAIVCLPVRGRLSFVVVVSKMVYQPVGAIVAVPSSSPVGESRWTATWVGTVVLAPPSSRNVSRGTAPKSKSLHSIQPFATMSRTTRREPSASVQGSLRTWSLPLVLDHAAVGKRSNRASGVTSFAGPGVKSWEVV